MVFISIGFWAILIMINIGVLVYNLVQIHRDLLKILEELKKK